MTTLPIGTTYRRLFTVTVQDGTGDTFTLGYHTFDESDIPQLVAREAAQFLAAHPAQVEQARLSILSIRPR
jgi:hypothetical protein